MNGESEKKYDLRALFVGVDRYQDTRLDPLHWASHDAEEMAATAACSESLRVGRHFYPYTNGQATRSAVLEALANVFPSQWTFDNETLALFFFSGHGIKDRRNDKIDLACANMDIADPAAGGISLNELHDYLHNSSAGYSIIVIDACFAGGLADPTKFEYSTPAEIARRSLDILYGKDNKNGGIFLSCRSDQKSREDDLMRHGIYTHEILRGWRDGQARNANGMVTLNSLRGYLEESFANYPMEQTPKANIYGSRPIELGRCEARPLAEPGRRDKQLPTPPLLTDVGGRSSFFVAPVTQRGSISQPRQLTLKGQIKALGKLIKTRPLPIAGLLLALTACVLSPILLTPVQTILLAIIFGLGIILPLLSLAINRVIGTLFMLGQLTLLVGFGYAHFHWRTNFSPVDNSMHMIAGVEWIFWVLFTCEMLLTLLLLLDAMMGGRG